MDPASRFDSSAPANVLYSGERGGGDGRRQAARAPANVEVGPFLAVRTKELLWLVGTGFLS